MDGEILIQVGGMAAWTSFSSSKGSWTRRTLVSFSPRPNQVNKVTYSQLSLKLSLNQAKRLGVNANSSWRLSVNSKPASVTYVHTNRQTDRHTDRQTYRHTYRQTGTDRQTNRYTYIAYMHAWLHVCMHRYIHASIHQSIHTYMHAYIHACIHTHTRIHTYMHTYILRKARACWQSSWHILREARTY